MIGDELAVLQSEVKRANTLKGAARVHQSQNESGASSSYQYAPASARAPQLVVVSVCPVVVVRTRFSRVGYIYMCPRSY